MGKYSELVDRILESDDFISLLRETKNYYTKTFDEFIKVIQDFDERIRKKGINTNLTFDPSGTLTWIVDQGYMKDKNRVLKMNSYNNGNCVCDTAVRFGVPGCTNLNSLVDANQMLKFLDGYVYSLERDALKNQNNGQQNTDDKEDDEKNADKNKDKDFKLGDAVVSVLDKLKTEGEGLLNKAKAIPPIEYNGKQYKIDKGELAASTEQEVVLFLQFPDDQELDIYDRGVNGQKLRRLILRSLNRAGFKGDHAAQFRKDMDKETYLYVPVGKMPVRKLAGPEAKAMLNYYDGKKVRFQPKEN